MWFLNRLMKKIICELYIIFHPFLWRHKVKLGGLPTFSGPYNIKIGDNCSINEKAHIMCSGGVAIGDRVTLSREVCILTQGFDISNYFDDSINRKLKHKAGSVTIGSDSWICARVLILPGASIPKGCVIAAGSVVTKSLEEENCLYGGCPAKKIRQLDFPVLRSRLSVSSKT